MNPQSIMCAECGKAFVSSIDYHEHHFWQHLSMYEDDAENPKSVPQANSSFANQKAAPIMSLNLPLMKAMRIPFEILPPGIGDYQDRLRQRLVNSPAIRSTRTTLDWSRLRALTKRFRPMWIAVGEKRWEGYFVMAFKESPRFLLDSVVYGHASYVIEGDWQEAIHLTKLELRRDSRIVSAKIVHSANWIDNLTAALKRRIL